MIRGLYLAGTGMLVNRAKMDVITNNLVNADTTGFKKDTMIVESFEDMLLERMNDPGTQTQVGPLAPGAHIEESVTNFNQGVTEETGLDTDLMLSGEGFFVVSDGENEYYTRAGNFAIDGMGFLVDMNGLYVQGDGGNIQFERDKMAVSYDGSVVDSVTGEQIDTLRIVEFEDLSELRKVGDNLFTDTGNAGLSEADGSTTVVQGYLEMSNVSIAQEMVEMLVTNRAYESSQRAAGMIDQTLNRTVNDIAKF